jgi:hypothetical protein
LYATVQELRDEGVTEAQASDSRLTTLLAEATETVDHLTGWFFEPRQMEIRLDGRGRQLIEPPIVPIAIQELWVEGVLLPPERYRVWGAPVPPRFSAPRIELLGARFPTGQGNVLARGTWGYTEHDGTELGRTPWAIRRAAMLIVMRLLPRIGDQDAVQEARDWWRVLEQRTRDQSVKFAAVSASSSAPRSGDPEVDALLAHYTRPIALGAA